MASSLVSIVLLFGMMAVGRMVWRMLRGRLLGKRKAPTAERCRCGYPIAGLSVARCPECGRVFGFDATPEELGLTDDQLRRIQEMRELRSGAARPPT